MSQSSFYGGRPGISFRIVKRFDGIDIPQVAGSYVYKKKEYAYRTIEGIDYFIYPFIEKTGTNYNDYDWKICELDGGNKNVVYSDETIGTESVDEIKAEGMIQCFQQGGSTTSIVNYGEFVLIDTITDLCDSFNPDNGKIFRRGTNLNYNINTNPYYGGEFIGNIAGSKGNMGDPGEAATIEIGSVTLGPTTSVINSGTDIHAVFDFVLEKGDKGDKGDKGERGNFNILAIYDTAGDIPNQAPEDIAGNPDRVGWDVLVRDSSDPEADAHLYVYDYITLTWNDVGSLLGNGSTTNNYTVCSTAGDAAAKTADIAAFVLKVGAQLIIKFENANFASNPTLNVSETGAKPLIANGQSAENVIVANSVFLAVYDGTNYVLVGGAGSGSGSNFIGTTAEWEALSAEEKNRYSQGIVFITDDASGGGGGVGGGHIIVNDEGTSLAQRPKLQFIGATITDDDEEETTVVEIDVPDIDIATEDSPGIVQPDNSTITVDENGIISAVSPEIPTATDSLLGISRPDNITITIQNGILTASGVVATERTLSSSGWNSSTGVYDLTSWYPNNSYDIVNILPNENTTTAQRAAWAAADCGGYRSTNTIKANGTIPTIDIVVTVFTKAK